MLKLIMPAYQNNCKNNNYILLTIDVEDWFQVENLKSGIPFSSWAASELRVERNIDALLDFLDSCRMTFSSRKYCATFFILGWLAERLPHMVQKIRSRGHEIASHGYNHDMCNTLPAAHLKKDLEDSRKRLEDIIGDRVAGYRAPNFSINNDILKIIQDCGYLYDSSYNSFYLHGRYGRLELCRNHHEGIAVKISNQFYEIPISNLQIGKMILPWGGGGYFRLIPFPIFKQGIRTILKKDAAYLFFMHPWEIDPHQPIVSSIPSSFKFRHYVNLDRTYDKLSALVKSFHTCSFVTCSQYLNSWRAKDCRSTAFKYTDNKNKGY